MKKWSLYPWSIGILTGCMLLTGCVRLQGETTGSSASTTQSSISEVEPPSSASDTNTATEVKTPETEAETMEHTPEAAQSTTQPATQVEPVATQGTASPKETEPVQTEGQQEAAEQSYDFSKPVPESEAVDNTYFEDAAFIGDSRTDGFYIYSGVGHGDNLTSNGLSIFKLQEKKAITIDGTKYTLLEALALKEYGKVYLSLGVNELGYYNDKGFYEAYCQAIDKIRESQPNAVIYIQGLIPINETVIAAKGGASYLTNEHLLVYNDIMKQVAEEKQVAFLDLNPEFTGVDGQLPEDASTDGVHLKKAYCKAWLEYLKTHTVSYETMYGTTEEGNETY